MWYLLRLPILALAGAALYALLCLPGWKRARMRPFVRHAVLWTAVCCGLSLLYLTILWYWPDITFHPGYHLLNLRPFVWVKETYVMGARRMAKQLALNIGMFVPVGLLLPMAFPGLRRFWKTALTALCITLAIETLQYFIGRSADVDDVIMNAIGGMLGYGAYRLLERWFGGRALWRKATGKAAA